MNHPLTAFREPMARSTSDLVYNTIRQAIVTGELPAGSRLVEAKVSKELNVSITPVREAFARLANQGLLTVFPYKGTYVTIMSWAMVRDVNDLRIRLEEMAAERGFDRLTEDDVKQIRALCSRSDEAYSQGDLEGAIHYDVLFHEQMFVATGSKLLLEVWNSIKYRIEYIQYYTKTSMRPKMTLRHQPMLEALERRDQTAYIAALREHLTSNLSRSMFPDEEEIRYE